MIQLGFSSLFYKPFSFSICLPLTSQDLPDGVFKSLEDSSFLAQICNKLQTPCYCCFSVTNSYPTLCNPMNWGMPGFPVLHYLPGFAQTQVHWVSDAIQPPHPMSPPSPPALPSVFLSISAFSSKLALCIRWPKYWSFSFSTSPSNEYSGLISLKIDWLDLLVVQGTLKSLLQHHSFKASTSALSLLYGPTLTSVHDYCKNHSFDYIKFCQQSDVSAF